MHRGSLTWGIPLAYLFCTLLIGLLTQRRQSGANDYLNASRSIALPLVTAAYLASNCGSLELVGIVAMASHAGVQAFQFFWIGAVPAMIFVALFLMPIYRRSGIRSVPEYLELRYGLRLRLLNAAANALIALLLSGVCLYAIAQVLGALLAVPFGSGILLCGSVVLLYVLLGGVRATMYNEVLQLLIIVIGLAPMAIYALRHAFRPLAGAHPAALHLWRGMPLYSRHAPLDVTGVVVGLGFVLSFGYWCTDFVLMQRAFTARSESSARQVPLWAGFGKLLFSFLVVIPGLVVFLGAPSPAVNHDQVLPMLMRAMYGPVMLGVALTALAASLMSGLAANVSAFAALWTEDIYKAWLRPGLSDRHYLHVGRWSALFAIAVGLAASYLNFLFSDLIEHVQLIFSVLGSPFWAIFLLGFFSRRANERGALLGFFSGAGFAFLHSLLVRTGWVQYGSVMSSDFYGAIYSFTIALAVCWLASVAVPTVHLQPRRTAVWAVHVPAYLWVLASLLMACCVALNFYWR